MKRTIGVPINPVDQKIINKRWDNNKGIHSDPKIHSFQKRNFGKNGTDDGENQKNNKKIIHILQPKPNRILKKTAFDGVFQQSPVRYNTQTDYAYNQKKDLMVGERVPQILIKNFFHRALSALVRILVRT